MDLQLYEKLRRINEAAVAPTWREDVAELEVDLQKEMKAAYKGKPTKLELSTWSSVREENQYKFWLLTDGTIIPVTRSHRETVENSVNLEGYWEGDPRIDFLETGAVAGYFSPNADEMGVTSGKKLTSKQIAKLKNLYLDYKVSTIYVEVGKMDFDSPIKSVSHLDYLLTYGKDVDEAKSEEDLDLFEKLRKVVEAVQVANPQKVIKTFYKTMPTKLTLSTWHGAEGNWYKFWLLADGTVIPVERSHLDTAIRAGLHSGRSLLASGAVRGHINNGTKELDIDCPEKLTSGQIIALKNLGIDYKVTSIVADIGRKDWTSPVESSKHLDYLLNYGPMDEAKLELVESVESWTRSEGEKYLASIESILQKAGYTGTIVGSVAIEGFSDHDLDIWLTPISDEADFTIVEDEIPMEMDYIGEDPPHYTILPDGKSVDFHLAEEEGELEERERCIVNYMIS